MMSHSFLKRLKRSMVSAVMIPCLIFSLTLGPGAAYALPQIDQVVNGSASGVTAGTAMTITASDSSIVNYKSFGIAEDESVMVNLPSATSKMLNRVTGNGLSGIYGRLESNGTIFLINTNGIVVGPTGTINAGSLVLSTRDISNDNFLKGNFLFEKPALKGQEKNADLLLLNEGDISVRQGGFGVLIGGAVENSGRILVPAGKAVLAGGDAVRLNMSANGLISVTIDKATAAAVLDPDGNAVSDQVSNHWDIEADGGAVIIAAESVPNIFSRAINLDGFTSAASVKDIDGVVRLESSGPIAVNGFVDATTLEVAGVSQAAPAAITIDRDFLDIAKLVISFQDIARQNIPDLGLDAGTVADGTTVTRSGTLSSAMASSTTTVSSYTDTKAWDTGTGTQYDTLRVVSQVVDQNKTTDELAVTNGVTTRDTSEYARSLEVSGTMTESTRTVENNNSQESTVQTDMTLQKTASVAIAQKVDRLNSANNTSTASQYDLSVLQLYNTDNKVVYNATGSEQIQKSSSLALRHEITTTSSQTGAAPAIVVMTDNNVSSLNVSKVITHTIYKKDGVQVNTMTLTRQSVNQDLVNTRASAGEAPNYVRSASTLQDIKEIAHKSAFYQATATGTQVTSTVKSSRDVTSRSNVSQLQNKVLTSSAAKTVTHADADTQSSTLTSAALSSLVRPLKDLSATKVVSPAVKKAQPLLLSESIVKEQRVIAMNSLSRRAVNQIDMARVVNVSEYAKRKDGYSSGSDYLYDRTLLTASASESSAVYKEKGIQQVQSYVKPAKVTSPTQQVVMPQASTISTWDRRTENTGSVLTKNTDKTRIQSSLDAVSTTANKRTDYTSEKIYDRSDEGSSLSTVHNTSVSDSQNASYRVTAADLLYANLKSLDLFQSAAVAKVIAGKAASAYRQETASVADSRTAGDYKRTTHTETRLKQATWTGANGKLNISTDQTERTGTSQASNTRTDSSSSYVSKINGKINYASSATSWSVTAVKTLGSMFINSSVLKTY